MSNVTWQLDPEGHATYLSYDAADRNVAGEDAIGGVTYFHYDAKGNRTVLIDAEAHATYFEWDAMDRMSKTKDAVGKEQGWEYDPVGDVSIRLDGNDEPTYYTYDAARQLTDIDYPDATQTSFAYDEAGNRTQMADSWGTTTWQYDELGRATVRTQPGDSHTYYAYDAVGNRASVIDPDANQAAYTYDAADRMSSVTGFGYTTYYEFDANGRMIEKLLGNGCVTYHNYDAAGRLASLENVKPDLSALCTFAYTYDKDSNITEIVRESGEVQYYSYDALHRLTSSDWRDSGLQQIYSFEYDYDGVGNRLRLGREYGDTYYTYDPANELVTETDPDGATSYEFDANGNQSAVTDDAGTTYYEWTPANMLSRIDFPDGSHNYFAYDGSLARVRKDDSAGTTKYTWDGLNILLERDAADQPVRSYAHGHTPIYGIASHLVKVHSGGDAFYHLDHIGTTVAVTDAAGAMQIEHTYSPFGIMLSGEPANGHYLFSSKPWDADARLWHFVARQMEPRRGAFLSPDPLKAAPRYSFCHSNPLRWVDPAGANPGGAQDPCAKLLAEAKRAMQLVGREADYLRGYARMAEARGNQEKAARYRDLADEAVKRGLRSVEPILQKLEECYNRKKALECPEQSKRTKPERPQNRNALLFYDEHAEWNPPPVNNDGEVGVDREHVILGTVISLIGFGMLAVTFVAIPGPGPDDLPGTLLWWGGAQIGGRIGCSIVIGTGGRIVCDAVVD